MPHTADPRWFWGVSRVCLMPSLWRESQGLVAVEALLNGVPVVASDRGALPETLGAAGLILPLPSWLTPASRRPPDAAEVGPWVEAVIRLWDDGEYAAEQTRRSLDAARRWINAAQGPDHARFFAMLRSTPCDRPSVVS